MRQAREFPALIEGVVAPSMLDAGFGRVKLKHCISYEGLFYRERIWLGLSWDWRDRWIDVKLGSLYWFQDVMPRVVVLGDYASYCPAVRSILDSPSIDLDKVARLLSDSIDDTLVAYTQHPPNHERELQRLSKWIIREATIDELAPSLAWNSSGAILLRLVTKIARRSILPRCHAKKPEVGATGSRKSIFTQIPAAQNGHFWGDITQTAIYVLMHQAA
jgi:hypothetical protein